MSVIMIFAFAGCTKNDPVVPAKPLEKDDFRLHNNSNDVYMTLGGFFNTEAILNENFKTKLPHDILLKSEDESKADKKYRIEVHDYAYTSVTISNIDYDTFGLPEDDYRINSVITTNPYYISDRGIVVGDEKIDVRKAYGPATSKETDEAYGYTSWTYQLDDDRLTFTFQGKYVVQITISNLPDNIYELSESENNEQVIMVDENGNIINGDGNYEVLVESNGDIISSQDTASQPAESGITSGYDIDTDSGTIIEIEGNDTHEINIGG